MPVEEGVKGVRDVARRRVIRILNIFTVVHRSSRTPRLPPNIANILFFPHP